MKKKVMRAPRGIREFLVALAICAVLVSMGLYRVWSQYQVIELGRELSESSSRFTELNETQRKLRLELSAAKRIDAIRTLAEDRFDMKIPERRDYIVVTK